MPLANLDPNAGSRQNISSQSSDHTRDFKRAERSTNKPDMFGTGNGVMSMLKTTTETGDLGALPTSKTSRFGRDPRLLQRPSAPNMSRTSSHYSRTGSVRSRGSNHSTQDQHSMPGSWPYKQFPNANPQDFAHQLHDGRPVHNLDLAERSHSLTHFQYPINKLNNHGSFSSLRSQGMVSRPSSPYVNAARFRHLSYRSTSPALSDSAGTLPVRRLPIRPGIAPRAFTSSPPPLINRHGSINRPPLHPPHAHLLAARSVETLRKPFNPSMPTHFTPPSITSSPIPVRPSTLSWRHANTHKPSSQFRGNALTAYNGQEDDDTMGFSHPSINNVASYTGFVQRVKTVLEERMSHEDIGLGGHYSSPGAEKQDIEAIELPAEPIFKQHTQGKVEKAVDPLVDVKSKLVLSTPTPPAAKRLTRELIKAAIDDTSESNLSPPGTHVAVVLDLKVLNSTNRSSTDTTGVDADPDERSSPQQQIGNVMDTPPSLWQKYADDSAIIDDTSTCLTSNPLPQSTQLAENLPLKQNPQDVLLADSSDERARSPSPSDARNSMTQEHNLASSPVQSPSNSTNVYHFDVHENPKNVPGGWDEESSETNPNVLDESCPENSPKQSQRIHAEPQRSSILGAPSWAMSSIMARRSASLVHHESEQSSLSTIDFSRAVDKPGEPSSLSTETSTSRDSQGNQTRTSKVHHALITSNTKTSAMRHFQFPLPDLAEDSQEEASTTNLRLLGIRPPNFVHGGKGLRGPKHSGRASAPVAQLPKSYIGPRLPNTREIPSLNFSRVDLTTKLTLALGFRASKSAEDLTQRRVSSELRASLRERPSSSHMFGGKRSSLPNKDDPTNSNRQSAEVRRLSRQYELLTEINRLSIPSVSNLTLRLSELLPSIQFKRSRVDLIANEETPKDRSSEDCETESTDGSTSAERSKNSIETEPQIAGPTNSEQTETKIMNTDSSIPISLGALRLMKELPPLPKEAEDSQRDYIADPGLETESTSVSDKTTNLVASVSSPVVPLNNPAELDTTLGHYDPAGDAIHELALPSPQKFKLKSSQRIREDSPRPNSRHEKSPWFDNTPPVDPNESISMAKTDSPGIRQHFKMRKPRSNATLPEDDTIRIVRNMSPGPRFDASLIPKADLFADSNAKNGQGGGLIDSISRKIGIRTRLDRAGFPIDPLFLHPEDRTVEPGDRYPTSGLTPPAGLNIDETRSYFSDDSSHRSEQVVSIRKRFTRLKPKRSSIRAFSPAGRSSDAHRSSNWTANDGSVFGESHVPAALNHRASDMALEPTLGVGMSKVEFRARRMIERLRTFRYRFGQLFRSVNTKSKGKAPDWSQHHVESDPDANT